MLIKNFEIRRKYINGFDAEIPEISVELYDLDRKIAIIEGNEVTDRMAQKIEGIELGLQMAGYSTNIERVIEVDMVTEKTRTSMLKS